MRSEKYLTDNNGRVEASNYCKTDDNLWIIQAHEYGSGYISIQNVGTEKFLDIGRGGIYMRSDTSSRYTGTRIKVHGCDGLCLWSYRDRSLQVSSLGSVSNSLDRGREERIVF